MLLVDRWATPTVVALETLDGGVAQPGYSSCLALEMRRDLNSAATLAGGTVYALIVLAWVSGVEVSALCVKYTHAGLTSHCCELYLGLLQHLSRPTGADEGPFNVSIGATPFSAFIEWMEPSDNIPLVTGYNITVETLLTKATRTVHIEGNSHKATVTGLTPFTKYFTVTAKYNCGFGPPSEAVVWRTREHGKLNALLGN